MIRNGDKVICIRKDYINSFGVNSELDLTIGESYIVHHRINYIHINGRDFGLDEKDDSYLRYYKDYFISLADIREQQIKSILDD